MPRAKTAVRPAPAAPDPAQARQQAAQGTILLVEPSAKTAKLLEECLRDTTFRITKVVPDVDRGYEAYLMSRPSLVLIDLHAPGVSQASAPGAPAFVKGFFELDPFARMVALSDERTRPLATEAVRIGARAYLEQPLTRSGVLEVLSRSLTVRTPAEAMRVPTLEWKRPVACSWRSVDAAAKGLAGSWQSVVARSLDPNGMETNLNVALKPGTIVRMNVELPGSGKPLLTLAEVVHAKSDPVLHHHVTRFVFLKLAAEGKDRLLKFLTDAAAKHAK